jgi:hypothetical protein
MDANAKPYGLRFMGAAPADDLEHGQVVVLDGRVVGTRPDPDDAARIIVTLVAALGPPPGTDPDRRAFEVSCPRDMAIAKAEPHNMNLAPLPSSS